VRASIGQFDNTPRPVLNPPYDPLAATHFENGQTNLFSLLPLSLSETVYNDTNQTLSSTDDIIIDSFGLSDLTFDYSNFPQISFEQSDSAQVLPGPVNAISPSALDVSTLDWLLTTPNTLTELPLEPIDTSSTSIYSSMRESDDNNSAEALGFDINGDLLRGIDFSTIRHVDIVGSPEYDDSDTSEESDDDTITSSLPLPLIHLAIEKKDYPLMAKLIQEGIDLNEKCDEGYNALHKLCFCAVGSYSLLSRSVKQNQEIASLMLTHGVDINSQDKDGRSILVTIMDYSDNNDEGSFSQWIFRKLLLRGVNCNYEAENINYSVLRSAAQCYKHEFLELLITRGGVNINKKYGNERLTVLHQMLAFTSPDNDDPHIISHLLNHGATVNIRDRSHSTPLHYAVRRGNAEIVSMLLDRGAKVHYQDRYGYTPLHWACEKGHLDIVKILEARGADMSMKDTFGAHVLDVAVRHKQHDVVEYLCSCGVMFEDVNMSRNA